ncbi:MAG: NUDIX hydrolase [Bifidobacterium animalis]|nr:NUDIX hydrolase [Bifidobacterium animalis]
MGCDRERNVESEIIDAMLDRSSDGVNMDIPARVLDSETKYRGAIFHVDDRRIALTRNNGDQIVIRRQVLVHAPCVVILVHDCVRDTYLVEREYRAGIGRFTYGLPAGLIDHDEDPHTAALRELREETGVVADTDGDEHVESAWVGWDDLLALPVTASNSIIAIQHEQIRRLREWSAK